MDAMHPRNPCPLAAALLMSIVGCSDGTQPHETPNGVEMTASSGNVADSDEADGSTGEPEAVDACTEACVDLGSRTGIATCHSCRCKVAFDDWLPSVDELQCGNGEPIVTYHAELSDPDFTLEPTAPGATRCANPSLLTGSCRQGSKLGQLTHHDVSVYWICREPYLDLDGSVIYEDMAVVGHNTRTGATCFWDDINDVMHEDDVPPLDLLEASEDERARSIELFQYNDGSTCATCHDHDPFIYTPYLQSTHWQSIAADKGPYHLVTLDGTPRPTGVMHLVSPPANACNSCHRLGSANTCSYFAPDSLAAAKTNAHEPQVHDAAEPGSPHWKLAHWMPSQAEAIADFIDWEATYAEARDHILECCESPGVDANGCEWAPVPAE